MAQNVGFPTWFPDHVINGFRLNDGCTCTFVDGPLTSQRSARWSASGKSLGFMVMTTRLWKSQSCACVKYITLCRLTDKKLNPWIRISSMTTLN